MFELKLNNKTILLKWGTWSMREFCVANNIGIERQGDPTVVHRLTGRGCSVTHTAVINVGSGNVFVNSKAIGRIGDSADSGSITSGSPNVFAN